MLEFSTFAMLIKVMSQTTTQPLVQVLEVSLIRNKRHILQKVSLHIGLGEIVSIIGPNGAGKTSLVKIIVGLTQSTSGQVVFSSKRRIGYMPQRLYVDPIFPLTVKRFLQLGQINRNLSTTLEEVGVVHVLNNALSTLSGGEFQRVLLARALLRQPELLVLDEPAQGVDLIGQGELYDLIRKIRDRHGCAILLVSHDLNVVMAQTDRVVCLNQHVCCSGLPENVSRDPAFAALFGQVAQNLAFYMHHHDHHHGVQGTVVKEKDD